MFLLIIGIAEIVGVFSCVLSELERCNIIHDRLAKDKKKSYRNFHEL
jgi:hypothetical protein